MLLSLLVAIIVLAIIYWLVEKVIVPALPAPWGRVVQVVFVIIVILWLLSTFLGLHL